MSDLPKCDVAQGHSQFGENEIARLVVDASFRIHTRLGPGLLESVYEAILAKDLVARGLRVKRQVGIPIVFDGVSFDEGFRADLIVNDRVIVELKSVEQLFTSTRETAADLPPYDRPATWPPHQFRGFTHKGWDKTSRQQTR